LNKTNILVILSHPIPSEVAVYYAIHESNKFQIAFEYDNFLLLFIYFQF